MLWSAQGAGSCETMAWLLESGSDFSKINSNGHGALHKAAQRGSSGAVKWLVNTFLLNDKKEEDVVDWTSLFICPDVEGNFPSDLCGMEGHESLAQWILKHEYDCIIRSFTSTSSSPDDTLLDMYHHCIPAWLQKDVHEALQCTTTTHTNVMDTHSWGAGCGVRRMALNLVRYFTRSASSQNEVVAAEPIDDINDID